MRFWLNTISFMFAQNFTRFPTAATGVINLRAADKDFTADVYRPKGRGNGATIMVIHGMAVEGHRDIRVIHLGKALAEAGFIAVAPLFPDIQDLQIHPGQWQDMAAVIRTVAGDPALCPRGKVALLGPSFSGGICLRAASKPDTVDCVSAICTVGAFANVQSTFDYFFRSNEPDEYGKTIALWNFAKYGIGHNQAVLDALKITSVDNGWRRKAEECELPKYLESMSKSDRELFDRLRYDGEFRLQLWEEKISKHPTLQEWIPAMEVGANLHPRLGPTALIHGKDDDVIHASESVSLHERMNALGIPNRLCLTPLISHGDSGLSLATLPEVGRLAAAFAYFFKHA